MPILALLALLFAAPAFAQHRVENALRDGIVSVEPGNPEMAQAFARARETLPRFFEALANPAPRMDTFAVKFGMKTPRGTEYLWLRDVRRQEGRVAGTIDNAPRWTDAVREGERITVAEREIVDWLFTEDGWMRGNFTGCAMNRMSSAQEAAAMANRFRKPCDD